MAAQNAFADLDLSIIGIDAKYPPHALDHKALEALANKFYPDTPAMKKVLSINRYTGIDRRASIGRPDHPSVNRKNAPTIAELHQVFMSEGVPLAVEAARKAIEEARIDLEDITHIVSTTCTDSANPGFDHFLAKDLGIKHQVEKVLLHGVGCSGGLAALRTAANLALGHTARGKPARILCVALEVSTTMVRSELDSIHDTQDTRIGVCLFSDCGSALVLSNGIGGARPPVYQLLGWDHRVLPETHNDLGFDADALGWKVVLTPRVPKLTADAVSPAFHDLKSSIPGLPHNYQDAEDFDWAMHPGGASILSGAERVLGITPQHMRASYDTYVNHGNSSSASIYRVMHRLRSTEMDPLAPSGRVRDYVVGCAFGPGITVEMCMLKRGRGGTSDIPTPPDLDIARESLGGVSAADDLERFIERQMLAVELD